MPVLSQSYDKNSWPVQAWKMPDGDSNTLAKAEELLLAADITIVDDDGNMRGWNKHDYVSMSPYRWPNPDTDDGLPYIWRDGEINPESRNYKDNEKLEQLTFDIVIFAQAFKMTGNKKYVDRASRMLKVFFVKRRTRMNPNLNHAQFIPGVNEGTAAGIITASICIPQLLAAMGNMEESAYWPKRLGKKMRSWMGDYYNWLTTSELGLNEAKDRDNHATYLDLQYLSLLKFLDKPKEAIIILQNRTIPRLVEVINDDGSQKMEIRRTRGFAYSVMNLDALMKLALMAEELEVDLWHIEKGNKYVIQSMVDYLIPYAVGEKEWDYMQIDKAEGASLNNALNIAADKYDNTQYISLTKQTLQTKIIGH